MLERKSYGAGFCRRTRLEDSALLLTSHLAAAVSYVAVFLSSKGKVQLRQEDGALLLGLHGIYDRKSNGSRGLKSDGAANIQLQCVAVVLKDPPTAEQCWRA